MAGCSADGSYDGVEPEALVPPENSQKEGILQI